MIAQRSHRKLHAPPRPARPGNTQHHAHGGTVALGLIRLATRDLIGVAADLALHTAGHGIERPFEQVASLPAGVVSQYHFAGQVAGLKRRSPAAVKCVQAVRMSVELPMRDGLLRELGIFKELVQSPESRALQYGFFSGKNARTTAVARGAARRGNVNAAT